LNTGDSHIGSLSQHRLSDQVSANTASPTGCTFAHIPTGTTTNQRIDVDEEEARSSAMIVASSAIGTDTEIGRATP
jgi:hypothetical protein